MSFDKMDDSVMMNFFAKWSEYPCLYDSSREDYRNVQFKERAREELAETFNLSGKLKLQLTI